MNLGGGGGTLMGVEIGADMWLEGLSSTRRNDDYVCCIDVSLHVNTDLSSIILTLDFRPDAFYVHSSHHAFRMQTPCVNRSKDRCTWQEYLFIQYYMYVRRAKQNKNFPPREQEQVLLASLP